MLFFCSWRAQGTEVQATFGVKGKLVGVLNDKQIEYLLAEPELSVEECSRRLKEVVDASPAVAPGRK